MSTSVVAAWDGSARGRDAVALAGVLARDLGASVVVAHVYSAYTNYPEFGEAFVVPAKETLERAPVDLLRGVEVDKALVMAPSAAAGLQELLEESGARMVVVGSTHRGSVGRAIPGSTAMHLLHGSPCAVAVAPAGYADSEAQAIHRIAVAYDGSPESRGAVNRATGIALAAGAALTVISVASPVNMAWVGPAISYPPVNLVDSERRLRERELGDLLPTLPAAVRAHGRLREGHPAEEIAAECEVGIDLLVMGSRGYGTLRRVLLGSVSSQVVNSAPCPVVVLPHSAMEADEPSQDPPAVATA